ncbi:MAG: DUF2062 domain-containing protein [Rubrivivax sp.]|nr:DUF2062 domain-containing protein [Rubrivivax sp.]
MPHRPQCADGECPRALVLFERLRKLIPSRETLERNRWLRWLGPGLFHPRLWHMSRRSISLGAAIGVFFAFIIPIAQIPLSAALALVLRANIPVAVASTIVNNPLTFPPVYYAAWRVGSFMLGEEAKESEAPSFAAGTGAAAETPGDTRSWWQRTRDGFAAVGKPLILGALSFAVFFSGLAYLLVNGIWHWRVRAKRRARMRLRSGLSS